MTEKQIVVELLVELGVSFQKAAQRLASSTDAPKTIQAEETISETKVEEVKEETKDGLLGLANMSNKEAMDLVTSTEHETSLKMIGSEEKSRGSKARKGVLKAVQAKLNKLKNPPAQAEVINETKAFSTSNPATSAADQKAFLAQFNKLDDNQKNEYFNGGIDSLGKSLVENTSAPSNDGEFEDLGMDAPKDAPAITAEELRSKLQAYAKAKGPDQAYAVLAHFGVKKIAELDASKYGEVAAELA